jgi:hypothetical protein
MLTVILVHFGVTDRLFFAESLCCWFKTLFSFSTNPGCLLPNGLVTGYVFTRGRLRSAKPTTSKLCPMTSISPGTLEKSCVASDLQAINTCLYTLVIDSVYTGIQPFVPDWACICLYISGEHVCTINYPWLTCKYEAEWNSQHKIFVSFLNSFLFSPIEVRSCVLHLRKTNARFLFIRYFFQKQEISVNKIYSKFRDGKRNFLYLIYGRKEQYKHKSKRH